MARSNDVVAEQPGSCPARPRESSDANLAMHAARRASEQAVMREAANVDRAISSQAVDDEVPGVSDAKFVREPTTPWAERVKPDASDCRNLLGAGPVGGGGHDGERGPH